MKIFGLEINRFKDKDQPVVIRNITPAANVAPTTKAISHIPRVLPPVLTYGQSYLYSRGQFTGGEYDLSEIGKIEDTDCYVRKAFQKKLGLMFKEGYNFVGRNALTVRYIKTRMAQIARASGIPQLELKKRIAASLIRTSNAYLVKVRDKKASGGGERKDARGKKLKPVAAYFPAAPETMRYAISQDNGQIVKWQQMLPDGQYKEFSVDDVVHFSINGREGFHLGVPDLVPVIDDIRALRHIEENIELLVYQFLFPLFHYKVGTETAPAGYSEDGQKEIDVVLDQIRYMPSEGAIVTPERHEINAIGAEGRALRAEGYLKHFKMRVFAGLGVSEVDMGEGQTTTRATAITLSRQLIDSVKDVQDSIESQWDEKVICELLLESTFGEKVLEEDNIVHLKFSEIDLNSSIELAKHYTDLFKNQGVTWDEYRTALGYEAIQVPEDPDDQDPSKYPEWFNTYWKLFEEPLNLIRAVDEPYSEAAKAMAASRSVSITKTQTAEASAEMVEAEKAMKPKPAAKAKKDFADSYIKTLLKDFESDSVERVVNSILTRRTIDKEWLLSNGMTWVSMSMRRLSEPLFTQLLDGFRSHVGRRVPVGQVALTSARTELERRVEYYLTKLVRNAVDLIVRRVDSIKENSPEIERLIRIEVQSAFDTVRYRTDFIWDVEFRKAYNYGRLIGARLLGQRGYVFEAHPDACDECRAMNGQFISVETASLEDIPPLHPHGRMKMSFQDKLGAAPLKDPSKPAVQQPDPALEEETATCPSCGNTMMKQHKAKTYHCPKCKKSYDEDQIDAEQKAQE